MLDAYLVGRGPGGDSVLLTPQRGCHAVVVFERTGEGRQVVVAQGIRQACEVHGRGMEVPPGELHFHFQYQRLETQALGQQATLQRARMHAEQLGD